MVLQETTHHSQVKFRGQIQCTWMYSCRIYGFAPYLVNFTSHCYYFVTYTVIMSVPHALLPIFFSCLNKTYLNLITFLFISISNSGILKLHIVHTDNQNDDIFTNRLATSRFLYLWDKLTMQSWLPIFKGDVKWQIKASIPALFKFKFSSFTSLIPAIHSCM